MGKMRAFTSRAMAVLVVLVVMAGFVGMAGAVD